MKITTITLLFFLSVNLLAYGMADWSLTTPKGTYIHNFYGSNVIEFSGDSTFSHLNEWYFYKFNIIGIVKKRLTWKPALNNPEFAIKYFIYNENNQTLRIYETKKEWENTLSGEHLIPNYTRWHNGHNWFFEIIEVLIYGILFLSTGSIFFISCFINLRKSYRIIAIIPVVLVSIFLYCYYYLLEGIYSF